LEPEAASIIAGLGEKGIQGEEMKVTAVQLQWFGRPKNCSGGCEVFYFFDLGSREENLGVED